MTGDLLTNVIVETISKYAASKEYGISLVNIPHFDYVEMAKKIKSEKKMEIFFLGFDEKIIYELHSNLPEKDDVKYSFSIEEAEESRNNGDENVFRILIIKRTELEKISSLRWFPEVSLESVYTKCCDYVKKELRDTNTVIEALLQALRCKTVRGILSFERVIDYLQILMTASSDTLPNDIRENFYKLGLLSDKDVVSNRPDKASFVNRIKRNHQVVERISNLEQAERQSITNYYAKKSANTEIPGLILNYYKTKDIELLKKMELEKVEECLKAVKEKKTKNAKTPKIPTVKSTALAAQLVFEGDTDKVETAIEQIEKKIDERTNLNKRERVEINLDGSKISIKTEPTTEKIADQFTSDEDFGGVIRAEVDSPEEAITDSEKYDFLPIKKGYLDEVGEELKRISEILSENVQIGKRIDAFLAARDAIAKYRKRLQDSPMLQVIYKYEEFDCYIREYEKLLVAINEDFPKIWGVAASNAKKIVNTVMALDYIFVMGETKLHAMPTPLHPLYLWKYVELAKEILSSRGISSIEEEFLDDDDKAFIIRKAEDIPDPLSVVLMPMTITGQAATFLPLSGRIGILPVYSNTPQINQSENGIITLKQAIVRYICLYPHAAMLLRIAIIDPPSVEVIISMLKALNADKEFNIEGIELTLFRTKKVSSSWVEIEDDSLNDGMLGRYKGKRSLNFRLKITNKSLPYNRILEEIKSNQHLVIVFDPNEVRIETAQNSRNIHIHPLCVPKIYKYNPINEEVEIRPASEGGIFTIYSSIIEKLNEHPSTFSHTGTFFRTPLRRETYDELLKKTDWLVILDQSLKSWDISLRTASEKIYYKDNDYRSLGIYSENCNKFILGYDTLVKQIGNFIPRKEGIKDVIEAVRDINDDGLLSIVSHKSNSIFDERHGKGSLGTAIAAIHFRRKHPNAIIVGLDTQLAQEWLSDRDEGELPDLVVMRINDDCSADIDIIEVKTYSNSENSFEVKNGRISGHAVKQVTILEKLIKEMLGAGERITTVSRREILREQVFDCLFHTNLDAGQKMRYCEDLNALFAGEYKISVVKSIAFIDFENTESTEAIYEGDEEFSGSDYTLITVGEREIQAILSGAEFDNLLSSSGDDAHETGGDEDASDANEDKRINTSRSDRVVKGDITSSEEGTDENDTIDEENNNLPSDTTSEANDTISRVKGKCAKLNKVFKDFGIQAEPVDISAVQEAARFTRFPVKLKSGETTNKLNKYKNDIGRELESNGEILIEHIKGTSLISVDVPFADSGRSIELIEHLDVLKNCEGRLNVIAGQMPDGQFDILDVAGAPHMLIAGTTGSGKTIFLQSMLVSLLYQFKPEEMELLIIDPKQTDFIFFEGLPYLYGGKVVIDAEEALEMLQQINSVDKEERTRLLRESRSRDIDSYNHKNPRNKIKRLVVVIDEYSDLIQVAEMNETRKDFEKNLLMLLQRVRNLGIHFIIATQRPSAQIVTGALKANIPFRVSFRLPSHTDSQTILDMSGAENLLGKGDMLMVTETDTKRMQGLYISEEELESFLADKM